MVSLQSSLRNVRCGRESRICRCGCVTCPHIRLPGLVPIEPCSTRVPSFPVLARVSTSRGSTPSDLT